MSTDQDKRKKPERPEDLEFAPDAWERFTRTVRRMAATPPTPHKTGGTADKPAADEGDSTARSAHRRARQ